MSNNRLAWPAFFALVTATLLWGGSFIAMKIAMRGFSPFLVVFCRMALASAVFGLLWRRLGGFRAAKGDWPAFLFMAFCEPCLYFVFEAKALTLTQASQAAMVTALLPLLTAVAAAVVLKEKLEGRTLAGLLLAVAGVMVMSLSGETTADAPRPVLGNFLEFLAMCCAVGYIITAKRLAVRHRPLYLTAMQSFVGAAFFAPVLLVTPLPERIEAGPALAVVFLGLGVTFVAYGLYNYGVSRAPAAKAAAFINLIPVFACLLSRFFLDENLTGLQWTGGVMALCGVGVSARPGRGHRQASRRE
jgi:drug/metabolite transporter (DMT)-like permease